MGIFQRCSGLTLAFAAWYLSAVPSRFKAQAVFSVLTSHLSQRPGLFWAANLAAVLVIAGLAVASLLKRAPLAKFLAAPAIILAVGLTAEFERVREFIRGPYLMPGYMYSNQILVIEEDYFRANPLLENAPWFSAAGGRGDENSEGAFLFMQNCSCCHTTGGINSVADRSRTLSRDGIRVILGHLHEMVPFMPPFSGTEEERDKLAAFLYRLAQGEIRLRPSGRILPLRVEDER